MLRAEALKRIFYEIPSDLDKGTDRGLSGSMICQDDDFTTLEMLNLAREHNLLSTLPLLRYRCCRLISKQKDLSKTRLDHQEATFCATKYVALMRLQGETTFSWIILPPSKYDGCQAIATCSATRRKLAVDMFFPVAKLIGLMIWQKGLGKGMCEICVSVAAVEHEIGRRRLWEALPGVFDLPGWEELNKERD